MNSEKIVRNKIILITFICSVLVIYIHAFNLSVYGITNDSKGFSRAVYWIETYWASLTRIAVPMFFFISGFLFFRTFSISKTRSKYVSRIKSILIPYLCWCNIYYFYYILVTHIPKIKNIMNGGVTELSFISWIRSMSIDSYYTLWFLKNLMLYILLSPLIYFFLKNWSNIPIGNIFIFLLLLNNYYSFLELPTGTEIYCCGSWIGINYKELAIEKNELVTKISLIYILSMLITSFNWYNIYTQVLLFIAIWYALDIVVLDMNFPWWMNITFFTYVAHDILLEGLEKLFLILFGQSSIMALLDYTIIPLITLAILIVIAGILRIKTPRLWRVFTGNR